MIRVDIAGGTGPSGVKLLWLRAPYPEAEVNNTINGTADHAAMNPKLMFRFGERPGPKQVLVLP